jgi:ADP-ribosylglycohydrolase
VASAVTHNDYASNASCAAFVAVLLRALGTKPPVPALFWLSRFVEIAAPLEGSDRRYVPRARGHGGREVSLTAFTDDGVRRALEEGASTVDACNRWYSGAFLLETVPSALYILERHGNDPEEAVVRAVNDTRDNDTIAAIVGAAVGALHGLEALPRRWRDGLLGRTDAANDGRVFELVEKARGALNEFGTDANPPS